MADNKDVSEHARALGKLGGLKGGKARAEQLSPERRSEIASKAAEARWDAEQQIPRAPYVGELQIAGRVIACAVLEDGTRLLNQGGFLKAIGRSRTPKAGTGATVAETPTFIAAKGLKPYITADLLASTQPIKFRDKKGRLAYGYKAELLPQVCEVFLRARDDGVLTHTQVHIARYCDILMRGFAHTGIIALVDEATGYQYDRARIELNQILEAYISEELLAWTRHFPDTFFREIYRLHSWEYKPGNHKHPKYVGKLIKKLVYKQLPPKVIETLEQKNPPTPKGWRKHKHFQFLTEGTGQPHLDKQIASVTTLMRASDDMEMFNKMFRRVFGDGSMQLPPAFNDEG